MRNSPRVAIIGAGPAGLVAARYLLQHGFDPVLFEQSSRLGGQWNQGASHSGVWPSMVTNTSRVNTHFSDLPWPAATPMFPHNEQVREYLVRYADTFGIAERIRFQHPVEMVECTGDGYDVVSMTPEGGRRIETFPYVIIATGRYNAPKLPSIPGLETFSGSGGVNHTFQFRGAERFRDQRVIIAGCGISAVEIAPELAMGGARRVISSLRRQRYVLQRVVAGVPIDLLMFSRLGALAAEHLPQDVLKKDLKDFILRTSGSPETWGAGKTDEDPSVAGITQAQFYLPLIAEGRIVSKPWIHQINGKLVTFDDGTEEEGDALLFATGFTLNLPFLSPAIRAEIGADGPALRLYKHTFHPHLPGMAFLGLVHQAGPLFPPLELQARLITYSWAGLSPRPDTQTMADEIAAETPSEAPLMMHRQCILFARAAGVEPDLAQYPELKRALLFGPLSAVSFRLSGPDALSDAAQRVAEEAAEFGLIKSPEFTADQLVEMERLR
jgi:hypothetical protein